MDEIFQLQKKLWPYFLLGEKSSRLALKMQSQACINDRTHGNPYGLLKIESRQTELPEQTNLSIWQNHSREMLFKSCTESFF